jgi:hypothetical protein
MITRMPIFHRVETHLVIIGLLLAVAGVWKGSL